MVQPGAGGSFLAPGEEEVAINWTGLQQVPLSVPSGHLRAASEFLRDYRPKAFGTSANEPGYFDAWSKYASFGLDPSSKRLADAVTNALPKATQATAEWEGSLRAMRILSSADSARLLEAAGLSQPQKVIGSYPLRELELRVSAVKMLAETAALERSLSTEAAVGLLSPWTETRKSSDLLAMAKDSRVQALRERHVRATLAAKLAGLLEAGDPTVQMVGPGGITPVGGLGGVPARVPVRMGWDKSGNRCLIPSKPSDLLLDPKSQKVGRDWDPAAFPDVGLLMKRKSGQASSAVEICSFVRISTTHILTAAHCVAHEKAKQAWEALEFGGKQVEAIAVVPNLKFATREPKKCFDAPKDCGFFVSAVSGSAEFPTKIRWKGVTPTPDVALLAAVFVGAPAPSTPLTSEASQPELTLAGYGLTNAGGKSYSGYLQVGWNRMPRELDDAVIVWDVAPADGNAGGCVGDSGGAVFSGAVAGPNDRRELAGLISFGQFPDNVEGIDQCMASVTGTATRLKAHLPWICSKLSNGASGCVAK